MKNVSLCRSILVFKECVEFYVAFAKFETCKSNIRPDNSIQNLKHHDKLVDCQNLTTLF